MKVNGILSAIKTTMGGLSTQMKRMNVVSENIANAERSADADGKVYQKKVMSYDKPNAGRTRSFNSELGLRMHRSNSSHIPSSSVSGRGRSDQRDLAKVEEQKGEMLVYKPDHPQADENGYVKMPKINVIEEMVDLMSASRTYEANVSVMNAAKQIAKRSLEI
jgi:flagellar basal-body rod protein FlgC